METNSLLQSINFRVRLTIGSCHLTARPFNPLDFYTGNVFDMLQHTRNHDNLTIVVLEIRVVSVRPELLRESEICGFNCEYFQVGAATEAHISLQLLFTFLNYLIHILTKKETIYKTNIHKY